MRAVIQYECAVCNQGRHADAGHYIAWVKTGIRERLTIKGAPQPMWAKFDDEKVLEICVYVYMCAYLFKYLHVCMCMQHLCVHPCLLLHAEDVCLYMSVATPERCVYMQCLHKWIFM